MLTRQFTVLFFIGPLVITCLYALPHSPKEKFYSKKEFKNLLICLFICCVISSIFYFDIYFIYRNILKRSSYIGQIDNPAILSFEHLIFYVKILPKQIGILSVFYLISFIFFTIKEKGFIKFLLFSWIAIPLIIFTFVPLKYAEYTMAYLPALALILAITIERIKPIGLKIIIVNILLITSICQYFLTYK